SRASTCATRVRGPAAPTGPSHLWELRELWGLWGLWELWELWERARARTLVATGTAPTTGWKSSGSALARERFSRPGPPPPLAGSPVGARLRANRSSGGTCHSTRRLLACQNPSTPGPVLQPDRIPERICATPPRQSGTYRV